jgi:chemotaxis protein MotA
MAHPAEDALRADRSTGGVRRLAVAPRAAASSPGYRVDILSIIGLVLAVGAIVVGQWIEGGAFGSLVHAAAFLIVVGGTLGAVMLQTPRATFVKGMLLARWAFTPPYIDNGAAIERITDWARAVRKEGILALENRLPECPDTYTRNGLQMLVDGFEPDKIKIAMDTEIASFEERHKTAARIWEAAGGYAPTVGILGAVLGLIHVMENLTDPSRLGSGIAVAFVATIYGVASANLIFLPIAGKLKALINAEIVHRELVQDGVLGIANGDNPRLIQIRLEGYLAG